MKGHSVFRFGWKNVFLFLLFCGLIYFPVFLHLDFLPLRMWDESLFALRALHFLQEGSFLYNFNQISDLPSHPNVKLPFTTFFQVLGLEVFGINELGLRLPVAFIFVATLFYVIYDLHKITGSVYPGYVFGLVLLTSTRFVDYHLLRTGDQDVPFACYLLLAVLFFYRFLKWSKSKDILLFSFFIIAALLTKNLLTGIILPGLLFYALLQKQLISLLKDYRTYVSLFLIIGVYAGTVFYFELQQPGFFERMWSHELGGRYARTIDKHGQGPLFYLLDLVNNFSPFIFYLPLLLLFLFDKKIQPAIRNLIILLFCVAASYLLVISFSGTKTVWYHAPMFPFVALIIGLGIYHFFSCYMPGRNFRFKWTAILAMVLIYVYAYNNVLQQIYLPEVALHKDEQYGPFIEAINEKEPGLRAFTIVDNNFSTAAYFTKEKYNAMDGAYKIGHQRSLQIDSGTVIMTCLDKVIEPLEEKYRLEPLHHYQYCRLFKVHERLKE